MITGFDMQRLYSLDARFKTQLVPANTLLASLPPQSRKGRKIITCIFGERKGGKILEKRILRKMVRGEMVRYLAEQQGGELEAARRFDQLGFRFTLEESSAERYVL